MFYADFMPGSREKQMENKQKNKKEKTDKELDQAESDFSSLFEPRDLHDL